MEVATHHPASAFPPSSHASDTTEQRATPGALEKVYNVDEWLASTPVAPPSKAANHGNSTPLVPVEVGARSSTNTIALHDTYQALAIERPEFIFDGASVRGWSVKTVFLGEELEEKGPYNSKQEAKEALSGRALEVIRSKEESGELEKPEKGKKKKRRRVVGGEEKVGQEELVKEKEPFVNYTGQLLEFQRSTNSPQPTYTDYALGAQFSCTCTISGVSSVFGSRTTLFPSKKAAHQNAAKLAIQHFKNLGLWPESATDVGGIKKKKTIQPPPAPKAKSPSSAGFENAANGASSHASQVASLALELGLSTPEWRYAVPGSAAAREFHTVSCYFKGNSEHGGPIGEVRHIYGKKKAKEECARKTLGYLMEVKEGRLRLKDMMMEGVRNGGDSGEVEDAEAKWQFEEDMGDGEDSYCREEFEDAMEEILKGDV